jgi:hypothetical protein
MNTFEKKLKTDGKKFNQVPNNAVHDKILQNLNNPTVDINAPRPKPLLWLIPIVTVIVLVTIINITWNSPNHIINNTNLSLEEASLDTLIKDIENNNISEIENEEMAIINDIKQFNDLFIL